MERLAKKTRRFILGKGLQFSGAIMLREATPTPTPPPEAPTATPTPPPPQAEVTASVDVDDGNQDTAEYPFILVPYYLNPREIYRCAVTATQLVGLVSYYSRNGCLGCSPSLRMANGVPLDDNRLTIACNNIPLFSNLQTNPSTRLSTPVKLTNLNNGLTICAWVTDTGQFAPRIADLTIATRDRLQAITDRSTIKIEQLAIIERDYSK